MKKFLTFLLAAALLCSMFVVTSAAADNVNYAEEIPFMETAPNIDGEISEGEYGEAQHSYSANPEQFVEEFYKLNDWDVSFYSGWDEENIYLAWEVYSPNGHMAFMPENDFNNNGSFEEDDYRWMWEYTCVQFILTPGDPTGGVDYSKNNNFLEVGLCLTENGTIARTIWFTPTGVNKADIDINSWSAMIVDNGDTVVYEVAIPKALSGLNEFGTDVKFGLSYAVGAQENFNTANGMLEWQDACLGNSGIKIPNNSGVVTLAGGDVNKETQKEELTEGTLPEDALAEGIANIKIDRVNFEVGTAGCNLITDLDSFYNGANSLCALLVPVEGEENTFTVAEVLVATGAEPVWNVDVPEGSCVIVANAGDETAASEAYPLIEATLVQDATVKLFGYDVAADKQLYTNVVLYSTEVVELPEEPSEPEVPEEPSEEPSEEPEEPSEEPEDEPSGDDFNTGDDASNEGENSGEGDKGDKGGDNTGLIIGIVIAVVVVAAVVVVVIVLKKKKK